MATRSNDTTALLDIAGVSKAFGSVEVLRSVSLKVEKGEVVTVRLQAGITEVGTLELEAVERTGRARWKVELDTRAST
jgi:ABC-type histidine transport system ATPase subunit